MSDDRQEITITPSKLSFYLSILTICGGIYMGVSTFVRFEARTSALEANSGQLSAEVSKLSDAVVQLNLTLREVQVIQNQTSKPR